MQGMADVAMRAAPERAQDRERDGLQMKAAEEANAPRPLADVVGDGIRT
jgi:hypothetical protein